MAKNQKPVVNVVIENLVVVNREIATNEKPAGAGMFKAIVVRVIGSCVLLLVGEVFKGMSIMNLLS